MKKRTTDQNRRLYFLFSKLGFDDDMKLAAIEGTTNGRTDNSSELSFDEAQQLIDILNKEWQKMRPEQSEKREEAKLRQQLRRNIFKMMYDLGYIDNTMKNEQKILVIENFCSQKTKIEKSLNSLTIDDLQKVIRQLQAIRRNYSEKQKNNQDGTKTRRI